MIEQETESLARQRVREQQEIQRVAAEKRDAEAAAERRREEQVKQRREALDVAIRAGVIGSAVIPAAKSIEAYLFGDPEPSRTERSPDDPAGLAI